MGFRVNSEALRGLRVVTKKQKEIAPRSTTLSAAGSKPAVSFSQDSSSASPKIPGSLSGLLTATTQNSTTIADKISFSKPVNTFGDDAKLEIIQAAKSEDAQRRALATEGVGDRTFGRTNTPAVGAELIFENGAVFTPDAMDVSDALTFSAKDLKQIRETVYTIATEYVSNQLHQVDQGHIQPWTPEDADRNGFPDLHQLKESDVIAAVDSALGEGTSEIFNLRLEDLGGGKTAIKTDQVEQDDLDSDEIAVLQTALTTSNLNFKEVDFKNALTGPDVDQDLRQLGSLLGIEGMPVLEDLKASLRQPSDIKSALKKAADEIDELSLTKEQKQKAAEILNDLHKKNETALASFEKNPLADEIVSVIHTGRYNVAWDSDDIEESAKLTMQETWRTLDRIRNGQNG